MNVTHNMYYSGEGDRIDDSGWVALVGVIIIIAIIVLAYLKIL